jgi:hypothetical protein
MKNNNRLGWEVEFVESGYLVPWHVVTKHGSFVSSYGTREAAEKFITDEIARRNRNNARARGRHSLMTSLGLKRNLDGSYE